MAIDFQPIEQSQTQSKIDFQPMDSSSIKKTPLYDKLGMSLTPEQKTAHPVLAGVDQTARDVTTLGYKAADALSLGNISSQLKKHDIEPPNFEDTAPENKSGLNLAGDAIGLRGLLTHPLVRAGGAAVEAGKVGTAAAIGGATGALAAPENDTLGNRAIQAGVGAVGGGGMAKTPQIIQSVGSAINNVKKSAESYVTDVVVPKAHKMYQDAVNNFTPEIRKFATDKLKIPQSAVDTIRRNGVQSVQNIRNSYGDSTDPIFQKINQGIQDFRIKADDAYKSAMDAVPEDSLFKINGTYDNLENALQKNKLIDLVGNPTQRLAGADPVYQKLNNIYQDMKASLVTDGKATGQVPKSDFSYYRDSLNRLYRDNPADRDVMGVMNTLYDDADKAGFNGIKQARNLQKQAFEVENKYANSPLIKEGKLDNFHNLTDNDKRTLASLQGKIGVNFIDDLENVSAGKYLDKLNEFNKDRFVTDLNAASDPKMTNHIKSKYEDLLGKSNADSIFDDIIASRTGRKIKTAGKVLAGAGAGSGIGILIKDKIFGH